MQWHARLSRLAGSLRLAKKAGLVHSGHDPSDLSISAPISTETLQEDYASKHPPDIDGHPLDVPFDGEDCDSLLPISGEPVCQIMSDLHLEWRGYEEFEITRQAPILLLVGHIGSFCDYDRFLGFLRCQCKVFDRVLLVPGNHEFYGSSRQEGFEAAANFESELGEKFVFMHRGQVDLHDSEVVILGCTLHSYIPENYTALTNDFNRINGWRVRQHNEEHAADLEWLKKSLAEISASAKQSRVVLATHYAPAFEKTVHPSQEYNNLSTSFSSNVLSQLQDWTGADRVSHWVFGHTHFNALFKCNGVIVVSNQPPGPKPDDRSGRRFNPKLVV